MLALVVSSSALLLDTPASTRPRSFGRRELISSATAASAATALLGAPLRTPAASERKFYATEGGVKYFDLEEGQCKLFNVACTPQKGDLLKIKYDAFLSNGKMFDSSENPGRKPIVAVYKSGALLPGWEEALATMKEGGTRVIQVPPALAYGDKGIKIQQKDGSFEYLVPPNEKLQYKLTLVQVAAPPP